jgi:hypothetical protein
MATTIRPLYQIASEIRKDWKPMYRPAGAHLEAWDGATSMDEMYGCDSVRSEVAYFLANAQTWRGETARRIKKELNAMLKR